MATATRKVVPTPQPTLKSGVVKWFNDEKSYGFIKQDDGRPELFFHRNDITSVNQGCVPSLYAGARVTFKETLEKREPRAEQVTKL